MSLRRDQLFPVTSIGRSPSGSSVHRTPSQESLSAHPLLSTSPAHAPSIPPEISSTNTSTLPRYVPYTPRQRGAPTSTMTVTGATSQSSVVAASPQQVASGDARSKLQAMSLKAAAQAAGLDAGSVGWAILERLVGDGDHGTEWTSVWEALATEKATLLLPSESIHSSDHINVDFVKDHIVICNGSSRQDAPVITLSGLRGQISANTLVFRSSILPTTPSFQQILALSSRSAALASLPPMPQLPVSSSIPYPSFSILTYTEALPLPPRPVGPLKPAFPPRPNLKGSPLHAPSRLPNPFSFFGKGSAVPALTAPSSQQSTELEAVIEVPAFIIDRKVVLRDVGKHLTKALRAEIKDLLSAASVPTAVADRVQGLIAIYQPVLKMTKRSGQPNQSSSLMNPAYEINPRVEDAEDIAQAFQEFYDIIEEELYATGSPNLLTRIRPEGSSDEKERERKAKNQELNEVRIKDILEVIERTVCTLLYDRLFSPTSADDASHDQALSSRVAALNATDLGLAHLGVEVGPVSSEVDSVVNACGEMLANLHACRSPADKAAILVAAHRVIVDGLGRLPPLRLKSDAEIANQQTPQSSQTPQTSQFLLPEQDAQAGSSESPTTGDVSQPMPSVSPTLVISPDGEPSPGLPTINDTHPVDLTKSLEPTSSSLSPQPDSLHVRSDSPMLTISPPPERQVTQVSNDILMPMLIYAVVKTNPAHLVSQLLYIQRFRNRTFGGEESYCLINLMAVAEFLENVDLASLGLEGLEGQAVPSTAELQPIALARGGLDPSSPQLPPPSLRGRVEQQVDALAGSANKVFYGVTGVVDSSFGVLRSFLPGGPDAAAVTPAVDADQNAAPWNAMRPAFGILRRESGFSIASLTASLPGGRERARSVANPEESGRQMTEVTSRPASRASLYVPLEESEEEDNDDRSEDEDSADGNHDTRSIRSFGSMMSDRRKAISRKTLSDRLASMPGLGRLGGDGSKTSPPTSRPGSMLIPDSERSPPTSRRSSLLLAPNVGSPATKRLSLLPPPPPSTGETPVTSRDPSPSPIRVRLAPPNPRFLDCAEDDLKMSEIRELLKDYRRLVDGIRAADGFAES